MDENTSAVLDRAQLMLPGPELIAVLALIDVGTLGDSDTFRYVGLTSRCRSWLEARELRALARIAGPSDDSRSQAASLLGVTTHIGEGTARNRIELAVSLVERLPATRAAFASGDLHLGQVLVIAEETNHLDDTDARVVEGEVAVTSVERTPASIRRIAKRRALRIDPASQHKRHEAAARNRSVYLRLLGDGMAELGAYLPAGEAVRCRAAIEVAARKRPDHREGLDARRADAFAGLLSGDRAPQVELILRVTDDQPVSVPGIGPIDADAVRTVLAPAAKVVIRPIGAAPLAEKTYRASARLARWVRTVHPTCGFPDCPRPSHRCDVDHVKSYGTGGKTAPCNLIPLCRYHHRLKTFAGWTPTLRPDRSISWTTPYGHILDLPPPAD